MDVLTKEQMDKMWQEVWQKLYDNFDKYFPHNTLKETKNGRQS